MTAQARVDKGVPTAGEFAATVHTDDVVALTPPPPNPAAVFSAAVGTAKDPNTIPWPDAPANARVEVYVDDDDLNEVLDRCGFDGEEADAYSRVYASIDLVHYKDCDFYGITKDGKVEVIALGIRDYEQAVDPDDHENLRYRDGFTNPMPPYLAAREQTKAQRLEASAALLAEAGVTVELEDLRRGHFRLKRGTANDMRLEIEDYRSRLTETTNWHRATDEHYASFLDGDTDEETRALLSLSVTLVARDLKDKGYKSLYGR